MKGGIGAVLTAVAQPLVWASAPVMLLQGGRVRRRTPVLPPASGERGRAGAPPPGPGRSGIPAGGGAPLRLLVLGDSTAAGVGACTQEDALAGRLAAGLAQECGRDVEWRVAARSGADSGTVAAELLPAALAAPPRPDLVVVLSGVNDVKGMTSRRAYGRSVAALASGVRDRAQAPVVFGAVPPMGRFPALPWPLRPMLGLRSHYLDAALAEALRAFPEAVHAALPGSVVGGKGFFGADGFHPCSEGYRTWARYLVPACRRALGYAPAEHGAAEPA